MKENNREETVKGIHYLTVVKNQGVNLTASFHNDYESVADFEQKHNVQLPEYIVSMVTKQ